MTTGQAAASRHTVILWCPKTRSRCDVSPFTACLMHWWHDWHQRPECSRLTQKLPFCPFRGAKKTENIPKRVTNGEPFQSSGCFDSFRLQNCNYSSLDSTDSSVTLTIGYLKAGTIIRYIGIISRDGLFLPKIPSDQ